MIAKDISGTDAIFICYPDYVIRGSHNLPIPSLGHAGVLLINNETGEASYSAFGRYNGEVNGKVISSGGKEVPALPNVDFDKSGIPTQESLSVILNTLSDADGQKGSIYGTYIKCDYYYLMKHTAEFYSEKYDILNNNCGNFALNVILTDHNVKGDITYPLINYPISMFNSLASNFKSFYYDPAKTSFAPVPYLINPDAKYLWDMR